MEISYECEPPIKPFAPFISRFLSLAVMNSGRCRCAMPCSRTTDTVRPVESSRTQRACSCQWDSRGKDTSTLSDTTQ